MTPRTALEFGVRELGLKLPLGASEALLRYLELIAKWTRTYNLTAIRDPLRMVSHHLLDSLAVLPYLPEGPLADIGAGAGLPGVPIAIAEPDRSVTLTESSAKKAAFLQQVRIELHLSNARIHAGRVEDWKPMERFAVVISRGFAELSSFVDSCRHLVRPGGVLAAMKGAMVVDELRSVARDAHCGESIRLKVPLLEAERYLIVCRPGA